MKKWQVELRDRRQTLGYPEANSQGWAVSLSLGTGWSWAQPKKVKKDKKSSLYEWVTMRSPTKEDKAWRKVSWLVQNSKFPKNGKRVREVLLYPCGSTPRAGTSAIPVLAHQQAPKESLLKQTGMEGVTNVVQWPRREMWGASASYTEPVMSLFARALCLQTTET